MLYGVETVYDLGIIHNIIDPRHSLPSECDQIQSEMEMRLKEESQGIAARRTIHSYSGIAWLVKE